MEHPLKRSIAITLVLLAAGGLIACNAQPRAGTAQQESAVVKTSEQPLHALPEGTRWRLAASERPALQVPEAARVILQFGDGTIFGDSGCNRYTAGYTIDHGRITMQPIGATKRGCMGPINAVERAWFEALPTLQWISRDGDALLLRLAAGDTLRFVDAPLETE
jgi:heat shock protein HslJ